MDFRELVNSRRAINFFDPQRQVDPNLLRQAIEMAARAPSSYNLQPWSLIILTDPLQKAKLRELAFNQPKITEAPVVLMVLGDREGWSAGVPAADRLRAEMREEARPGFEAAAQGLYAESLEKRQAFACKNAGFFAMTLMLAAKSLGLETHPMDGFDHHAVRSAFNIPEKYWIPLLIAVGYFDSSQTLRPAPWRKTYEEIVVSF